MVSAYTIDMLVVLEFILKAQSVSVLSVFPHLFLIVSFIIP